MFATTHWSVVLAAGQRAPGEADSSRAHEALEVLCRAYWFPIYVYVRRKGHGPGDAEDLTQEFFAQLIEKQSLRLADREKGRFRTFLLAVLDYFLANQAARAHRQKRGGRFRFVSLNQQDAENSYRWEAIDDETPERSYQRQWALTVLGQAMATLAAECQSSGKSALFAEVKHLLSGERPDAAYGEIAARLGISEGALRVAVHRMRHRYGALLRKEIAQTVATRAEVEDELRFLLQMLSEA